LWVIIGLSTAGYLLVKFATVFHLSLRYVKRFRTRFGFVASVIAFQFWNFYYTMECIGKVDLFRCRLDPFAPDCQHMIKQLGGDFGVYLHLQRTTPKRQG